MSLFERITSSTPHTPEPQNIALLALVAGLILFTGFTVYRTETFDPVSYSIAASVLMGGTAVGAVGLGKQRQLQGDSSVPEPPVPPA